MLYKSIYGNVDLSNLVRLYGAALVEVEGQRAEMSLEWMDMSGDKVKLIEYVLVFDFTPQGSEERVKTTFSFPTKEALLQEMQNVADFIYASTK
jgi:hypothetical protein